MNSTNVVAETVSVGKGGIFQDALRRLETSLAHVEFCDEVPEILQHPEASLIVSIRVRMDDGALRVFQGYRVRHSTVAMIEMLSTFHAMPLTNAARYEPVRS